ncbi:AraC family transcriptional regulator [Sphingobacterium sp.]|uniref:helix-turn-helix domain-containing protein n=1 Tax=Sphingobacterium sp. TaxID=341027 RepID=UPI0028A885C5|nr:AraC family transcriptional regulator [Sphingobacterium sp.]
MEKDFLKWVSTEDQQVLTFQMKPEHFDFHSHAKAQLTLLEGGLTYLHTREKAYFIPSYHYVWIPPHLEHKFSHQREQHVLVRNLYIPLSKKQLKPFHQEIGIFPAHPLIIESLKFCGTSVFSKGEEQHSFLHSLVQLLPQLSPMRFSLALPTSNQHQLKPILSYISNMLHTDLRLEVVAKKFNLGMRSLSRLFEQHLHTSFLQFVKTARIIRSIELILARERSISEISYAVGYKSIASFSNTFLQTTGKRPTDFANDLLLK